MEGFSIDLKTFLGLTNTPKLSESKYQAGFGVGQNPQTFMIPIYSTTVLYDIAALYTIVIFPYFEDLSFW